MFTTARRVTLTLCLVPLVAHAQTGPDDLWSVYQTAVTQDPTFASEQFGYRANQEAVPQARSALRPNLNAFGSFGRQYLDIDTPGSPQASGDASFNNTDAGLSVTQPIYDKTSSLLVDQAEIFAYRASILLEDAKEALILKVGTRYFDLLSAQDNLELARGEVDALANQLKLDQERLEVGLGTETEVFDTQARFKLAQVDEIIAANSIDDARQSLVELTNQPVGEIKILDSAVPLGPPKPVEMKYWVDTALANNKSISSAREAAEIARREIEIRRSERMPRLDLVGSQNFGDSSGGITGAGSQSNSTEVLLQLSGNFYQGGLIGSRAEQARLEYQRSLSDLEAQIRATERSARDAYMDVLSNVDRIVALEQAVRASESALRAKQDGFEAGLNTNLDVLDARRDLVSAKRDYLRSRYDHILFFLTLHEVAGTLDDDILRDLNQALISP